jgi:hypothetical protein
MAWKEEKRQHKVRSDAKWDSKTAGIVGRALAFGMTYTDIGYLLAVKGHTIQDWQQRYPKFAKSVEEAREAVKSITIAQMLRCAWGYSAEKRTEKFNVSIDELGNEVSTDDKKVVTVVTEHIPPNGDLLKFILLNRDSENWKDVKRLDVRSNNSNLSITGDIEAEQIELLVGNLRKQINSKCVETDGTDNITKKNEEQGESKGIQQEILLEK